MQKLRHRYTAIMAGVGTVISDDPLLTCRGVRGGKNPVRIICDTRLRTPPAARVVATAGQAPTVIATCCDDPERHMVYQEAGCSVLTVKEKNGHVDLRELMRKLGKQGIDSILLEGGGTLNWAALERDCTEDRSISLPNCLEARLPKPRWRAPVFVPG